MPAFVNPYTQQLMNQPLDSNFPSQPVSSPNTTHLLAPQTGSVLQPLLDTVIGNKQRQAEQQQLDFQRQQVINKNLQQKAKRQALVNFVDRAAANPDSPAGRFITERFNDPQAAHDLAASGAFDPSTFLADFSKFSAGFSARSKELKTLKGVFARFKNSPLPQIIGADNVIAHLGDLAQSETGIAQARQTLTQLQNLQNELLQKQRTEHAVFTQDGKTFFRFNKRGGITPVKNVNTKTHKVINLNDFSTGIGTNEITLPSNVHEALGTTYSPAILQTNRDNAQVHALLNQRFQELATASGATLTEDVLKRLNDNATQALGNTSAPTDLNTVASNVFEDMFPTIANANTLLPQPSEGKILNENGQEIPVISKEALPIINATAAKLAEQELGTPATVGSDALAQVQHRIKINARTTEIKKELLQLRNTPEGKKQLADLIFKTQVNTLQNKKPSTLDNLGQAISSLFATGVPKL